LTALILVDKQQYTCFIECDVIVQFINLQELVDESRIQAVLRTVAYLIVNLIL